MIVTIGERLTYLETLKGMATKGGLLVGEAEGAHESAVDSARKKTSQPV